MKLLAGLALAWPCLALAADSDELLSRVVARLAEHAVIRAQFVQERFVAAMPAPSLSRGRLIVSRKDGVLWQIESPIHASLAFTPTQIIETGSDGVRRLRSPRGGATDAAVGRLMRGILGADADELRAQFEARAVGSLGRWSIRLAPKAREVARFVKAIHLSGGRFLDAIGIEETSGDRTAIRMHGFAVAAELEPDEREQFTAP
ncbi:MAG TPA: outer membrane lipoprotein carrier protein LolA [Burkholderiales bacterium]